MQKYFCIPWCKLLRLIRNRSHKSGIVLQCTAVVVFNIDVFQKMLIIEYAWKSSKTFRNFWISAKTFPFENCDIRLKHFQVKNLLVSGVLCVSNGNSSSELFDYHLVLIISVLLFLLSLLSWMFWKDLICAFHFKTAINMCPFQGRNQKFYRAGGRQGFPFPLPAKTLPFPQLEKFPPLDPSPLLKNNFHVIT